MPISSLQALGIAADPAAWRACGFAVGDEGVAVVGGIALRLGAEGSGITGWSLDGVDGAIDGLPTVPPPGSEVSDGTHPNGAAAVDHVVVTTPDLDRTMAAFSAAGLEARRVRDAGAVRQAFYVLGRALAEVAGPVGDDPAAPARFWGLTLVVSDLDRASEELGELGGAVKDAVQPGRRILTVRREAALGLPVALMSPRT